MSTPVDDPPSPPIDDPPSPPIDDPPNPPIDNPITTPPIDSPITTPPIDNPITTPPIDNPITTPPIDSPITTPPIDNPITTPPIDNPITTTPIDNPTTTPIDNPTTTPIDELPSTTSNGPTTGTSSDDELLSTPSNGPTTGTSSDDELTSTPSADEPDTIAFDDPTSTTSGGLSSIPPSRPTRTSSDDELPGTTSPGGPTSIPPDDEPDTFAFGEPTSTPSNESAATVASVDPSHSENGPWGTPTSSTAPPPPQVTEDVPPEDPRLEYQPAEAWQDTARENVSTDGQYHANCDSDTKITSSVGSNITFTFTGNRVELNAVSNQAGGRSLVRIDDGPAEEFVTYDRNVPSDECRVNSVYVRDNLADTNHTLFLQFEGKSNAGSADGQTSSSLEIKGLTVTRAEEPRGDTGPNIPAIVGGVAGGLIGLLILFFIWRKFLRRPQAVRQTW